MISITTDVFQAVCTGKRALRIIENVDDRV